MLSDDTIMPPGTRTPVPASSVLVICLSMARTEAPERAQWIRTLFDEVTRILNHLMWIGSNALDLGAMAVMLYAFRSEEHTSELQSLMRLSYAVFCLNTQKKEHT